MASVPDQRPAERLLPAAVPDRLVQMTPRRVGLLRLCAHVCAEFRYETGSVVGVLDYVNCLFLFPPIEPASP